MKVEIKKPCRLEAVKIELSFGIERLFCLDSFDCAGDAPQADRAEKVRELALLR